MYEPLLYGALALTGLSVAARITKTLRKYYAPRRLGLSGERRVHHILRTTGLRGSRRLRNILLPGGRDTSQIDNLYITRYGIFIIETKNYKGDILCDTHSPQWTQRTPSGKLRTFLNPTIQNTGHVQAVMSLLGPQYPNLRCFPIVAFSDTANLLVSVPDTVNFRNLRLAIKSRCSTEPIFSKAEVRAISRQLRRSNIKSFRRRRLHDIRANLASEAAKHQSNESVSALYEAARNTPITRFGQSFDLPTPERSREEQQLTDAGSFLRIGSRTGSIEDFLESAKRDAHGLPVPRGASCDHFICPYTGDSFPFSEFKSFYRGLWAAYLTKNPQLVSYMQKAGAQNIRCGVFRTDQVLQEYLADPDAFIASTKATAWYKNLEQKSKQARHSTLNKQVSDACASQSRKVDQTKQNTHTFQHTH